jgi:hypothetical protein
VYLPGHSTTTEKAQSAAQRLVIQRRASEGAQRPRVLVRCNDGLEVRCNAGFGSASPLPDDHPAWFEPAHDAASQNDLPSLCSLLQARSWKTHFESYHSWRT